jgi:hypothetical protein
VLPEQVCTHDGIIDGYGVRGKGHRLSGEPVCHHLGFSPKDDRKGKGSFAHALLLRKVIHSGSGYAHIARLEKLLGVEPWI